MDKVQAALEARKRRKQTDKTETSSTSVNATQNSVDSALEARKRRITSNLSSEIATIQKEYETAVNDFKSISTPSFGKDSLREALDAQRASRVNVSKLQKKLNAYRSYIGNDEAIDGMLSSLKQMEQGYDSYIKTAELYSQFETEDEFNSWYEPYKKQEEEKQAVLGADDFEEYSQKGASVSNPSWDNSYAPVDIFGWKPFGDGEEVTNMVAFAEENKDKAIADAARQVMSGGGTHEWTELVNLINQYMTDEEKSIYNYYVGKGDSEKANDYLTTLTDTLRQRQGGKIAENAKGNKFSELALAGVAGLDQFASGIKNIDNFILGTEADPTSSLQYASSEVRSEIDGGWGIAYDLLNTTTNMLPSILVGVATGGVGGAATMGVSAVGNGYSEMRKLGYDEWQSRGYGFLVGASEATLQYVLGGISKLGGKVTGKAISNFLSKFDNALARTAIKLGGNMASEGLEESIQTALEPAIKALMTGEDFEAAEWDEILYSGLLGALSAGVLEGGPTIAGTVSSSINASKIYGDNAQDLVTESIEIDPDNAHAQRMQARLDNGKKLSGYQLNRLVEATESGMRSHQAAAIQRAVTARLSELGEAGDVNTLAAALTKQMTGQKLTRAEQRTITTSKYGQRVANEINTENISSGKYSSEWTRNIGTNRKTSEERSKTIEAADISTDQDSSVVPIADETEKESITRGKFEVSDDGETINTKTNDPIEIIGIAAIKDGEMILKTDSGETVNAKDVSFKSEDEALLYSTVLDMGVNAAVADSLVRNFAPADGVSAMQYALGIQEAYKYGKYGIPQQEMSSNGFSADLTEAQKVHAYNLGTTDAKAIIAAAQKKATASEKKAVADKSGKVHFNGDRTTVTQRQKASLDALDEVADTLGVEIYVFESFKEKNGNRVYKDENGEIKPAPNGWYDPSDSSIHLDLNAGANGEGVLLFTAAHELTHFIRQWSPAKFKILADFLMEQYGKKGVSVDALVKQQIEKADRHGRKISYDEAYEEVVADSMETMFADGDAVEKLALLKTKDKSLWAKIKNFINDLVTKIREVYEGLVPDSAEGKYVAEMRDAAERLQELFTDALVDASDNYSDENVAEKRKFSFRNANHGFDIKSINDYVGVQKAVINTLSEEGFFSEGHNIVKNADSGMIVEITKDGIRETLGPKTRFQTLPRAIKELKLFTLRKLPELIKSAQLLQDNVPNTHNTSGKLTFAYLGNDIVVQDGNEEIPYAVAITIRKSTQKNMFWIHQIRTIKKEQGLSSSGDLNPQQEYNKTLTHGDSISQNSNHVKKKFSDRDSDGTSNRSLLANALESTVQNDIERNKLREYRSKIDLIESEEKKLSEIRGQIKEITFSSGKRDMAKLKRLQDSATRIANRINIYDKQLLTLEASKPLKNVLEREKDRAEKRQRQKDEEILKKYKEKAANTQKEIVSRYQKSRKNAIEGRNKTAMRHKIQNVVKELNELLIRGTKDRHIMIGLQKAVAEALNAVNMDTVGADERVAKYNALIAKEKDPDIVVSLIETRDRIQRQGDNMSDRLTALKNAYGDIRNSEDPLIANSYDEVISSRIEAVTESVGDTPLRNMTLSQLEDVYDMYKMVLTKVRNANRAFKNARNESISTLGNKVMHEVEKVGGNHPHSLKWLDGAKSFGWNALKPAYVFKLIGSDTLTDTFNKVRLGEDTWAIDVSEARDYYREKTVQYKYDSWDFNKTYSFKSTSGIDFTLTLEQIMSLYAYSKREQADLHLQYGGFVFDDSIEVVQKKHGVPVKYNVKTANAHNLSKDTLGSIIGTLTSEQKAFVDTMQDYLSTVMGEKGNEVSLEMYGVKLFKEKNYFPLKSAKQYMFEQNEVAGEVKIKNAGFSKETVPKARNPIILSNFTDVWANHVNDMSMYHAFVLPLEDFNRVFNYKTPTSENMSTESVKMFLQNAYGRQAEQYIRQLLTDLNGGVRVDSTTGIINKSIALFKKAAVFASASVVIQQPSAIARATAIIDPKYFVTKIGLKDHGKIWEEVKKYAPVAIIKEMGRFDTNVGQQTIEWITSSEYKGFGEKAKAVFADSNYRDELLSKAPALADELAWCYLWNAVKNEVRTTTKLDVGSEAFLKKCGERFTEVVTLTQVYDSVLSRSGMMRSKDTGMKMATAFMAESTTALNMMADSLLQGKRGNKKSARKAVGAVASAIILNSILSSLVFAARDDDDDETYAEKYLGSLAAELLDGFNPLTYIPFIKDIWSIAQGYDVERSDMSIYGKLWESVEQLFNKNASAYKKVESFAGSVASIFGLPVKNILRDARAMYTLATNKLGINDTTTAGIGDSVMDAVRSSVPLWGRLFEEDSNSDKLYDAIISGDATQIKRAKSKYKDDNAINTAIRTALRENDPRIKEAATAKAGGDMDEYLRLAKEIVAENNFSQDNVVAAINAEINAMSKEESTESTSQKAKGYFNAEDFAVAISQGDRAMANAIKTDIIRTAQKNGKTAEEAEKSFINSATDACKDLFNEGKISEQHAIDALESYCGKTEEDAISKVQYWAFKLDYPGVYVDDKWIEEYYIEVADSDVSIDVFVDYRNKVKNITGEDKKERRMAVIDSLPLTSAQKDALYYAEGWPSSTIHDAPWR